MIKLDKAAGKKTEEIEAAAQEAHACEVKAWEARKTWEDAQKKADQDLEALRAAHEAVWESRDAAHEALTKAVQAEQKAARAKEALDNLESR